MGGTCVVWGATVVRVGVVLQWCHCGSCSGVPVGPAVVQLWPLSGAAVASQWCSRGPHRNLTGVSTGLTVTSLVSPLASLVSTLASLVSTLASLAPRPRLSLWRLPRSMDQCSLRLWVRVVDKTP